METLLSQKIIDREWNQGLEVGYQIWKSTHGIMKEKVKLEKSKRRIYKTSDGVKEGY